MTQTCPALCRSGTTRVLRRPARAAEPRPPRWQGPSARGSERWDSNPAPGSLLPEAVAVNGLCPAMVTRLRRPLVPAGTQGSAERGPRSAARRGSSSCLRSRLAEGSGRQPAVDRDVDWPRGPQRRYSAKGASGCMPVRPSTSPSRRRMPAGRIPSRSMTAREARLCTSVNATTGRSG